MEKLRFKYKKYWEFGSFQETYISFHKSNSTCSKSTCHEPKVSKLITRLRLGLSHLWFHKFKHSFQDTLNPICNCGTIETTVGYLLYWPNFSNERLNLFNKLRSTDESILRKNNSNIIKALLCGDHSFNDVKNTSILVATFEYINWTKRLKLPYNKIYTNLFVCVIYFYFSSRKFLFVYIICYFVCSRFAIVFFRLFFEISLDF